MALVLLGRIVTFDEAQPEIQNGAIYIADDGLIEAVQPVAEPAPSGFAGAATVGTGGVIYPGLIDLHNHLAYNCRSLWIPPRGEPYTSRDQWPGASTYAAEIRDPAHALGQVAGNAVLKFAETKAVVGGVTAIQGSPTTTRPFEGWMVRNVEDETFGTHR